MYVTYGGEHSSGEIKGTGELPLDTRFVWYTLNDDGTKDAIIFLRDVVLPHQQFLDVVQSFFLPVLVVRLKRIKNCRPHQQIRERAHN